MLFLANKCVSSVRLVPSIVHLGYCGDDYRVVLCTPRHISPTCKCPQSGISM